MSTINPAPGNGTSPDLTVFYDGACPLCRREIGFYRRLEGSEQIEWIDVSAGSAGSVAPGLCRTDALKRFHVRLADGRLESGARGFAELWAALPAFRWLGAIARLPVISSVLEVAYRGFLRIRPALTRRARRAETTAEERYPRWLEKALRSDHAGETGAVAIYEGILWVSRDRRVRDFAHRHIAAEMRHLAIMEELIVPARPSRLLPLWRAAGFLTGAIPALFGPRAVYATIDAVETFVDGHYRRQIEALEGNDRWRTIRETLESCRRDEVDHRDEARHLCHRCRGPAARVWARIVTFGSALGVATAERV